MNYYLINKEWVNYLNKCYNYEQISQAINNCEKNKELINKYRESITESEFDLNDINYIISRIPQDLKNDINNKDKAYDINLFKSIEYKIKEGNKEIYYYDDCILISEYIKDILVNINRIYDKFDNCVNCFISLHNIYLCYKLKNNSVISIGKTDENNILKINILVVLENDSDYINYMREIIIKGKIPRLIYQLRHEKQKVKLLYNGENKYFGYALLLDNQNEENNFSNQKEENKKNEDEENIKIVNKNSTIISDKLDNSLKEKIKLNKNKPEDENNKLKDELNNYKRENEKLKKEIDKLKEDNMKLNSELMNSKKIINDLNNNQENNQENIKMINNLNKLIQVKNNEINDLKMKLIDIGKNNRLVKYDDIFFVHFISKDEKISCGIKCLKTDTFAEVEEKFYEKYPEYRETNNKFLLRGKLILRNKKICENNIKDCDMILFINT